MLLTRRSSCTIRFETQPMTSAVHVGAILIEDRPLMTRALNIDSTPYGCNWSVVQSLSGFDLDHKIHAAGWNFFFMAGELKTRFLGAVSQPSLHAALMRILARMRGQNFNRLEVTGNQWQTFSGGSLHRGFCTLAPHPAGLPPGSRRATSDAANGCRMGARLMMTECF